MQSCYRCNEQKGLKEFNKSQLNKGNYICRDCQRIDSRGFRLSRFDISSYDETKLKELQDNKCAICLKEFDDKRQPCIDHDHSCCPNYSLAVSVLEVCYVYLVTRV